MSSKETINMNWPPERTVKHGKCLKRISEEAVQIINVENSGRVINTVDGPNRD